jgi:hypothetical protein
MFLCFFSKTLTYELSVDYFMYKITICYFLCWSEVGMLTNLATEQARNGHSDGYVAGKLGLSPQEYGLRKESGTFLLPEVEALLNMYNKPFEYLFQAKAGAGLPEKRGLLQITD